MIRPTPRRTRTHTLLPYTTFLRFEVRTELRVDVDEARLRILARQCIGQCRAVPGIGHTGPREIVEHERGAGRAKNIGTERIELRADEHRYIALQHRTPQVGSELGDDQTLFAKRGEIGRASWRDSVCAYG